MKHWQVTVVPWSWTQRFCFLFIYILLGVFYYIFQKSVWDLHFRFSLDWISGCLSFIYCGVACLRSVLSHYFHCVLWFLYSLACSNHLPDSSRQLTMTVFKFNNKYRHVWVFLWVIPCIVRKFRFPTSLTTWEHRKATI